VVVRRYCIEFVWLMAFMLLLVGPAVAGTGGSCGIGGTKVPEPAALALLGAGVAGILAIRHRRRRRD
jgi:PEP-CTERM motif